MCNKTAHRTTQLDFLLINFYDLPITFSWSVSNVYFLADLKWESLEKEYLFFHFVTSE